MILKRGIVLTRSDVENSPEVNVGLICSFVKQTSGLDVELDASSIKILQKTDQKILSFPQESIEEVLSRTDSEGQPFLQVNFCDGKKILLTARLIGFKPAPCTGLDITKLPKVVTTPDLVSVVEAIEESMFSEQNSTEEIDVLRRVFDSVLEGAEAVGFELESERAWLKRLATVKHRPTA